MDTSWTAMLNIVKRIYLCPVCRIAYDSEQLLARHFKDVKNHGYANSCAKCGKVFKTKRGYQRHFRTKHGGSCV